jgi:hypothetical protein
MISIRYAINGNQTKAEEHDLFKKGHIMTIMTFSEDGLDFSRME